MTKRATEDLYKIILADTAKKDDFDTSDKAIISCLRRMADLFTNALEDNEDSCFIAAVRFDRIRILRIIFEYYKYNDKQIKQIIDGKHAESKQIDFSQMALSQKKYKINLLQYVFKYGSAEIFEKCYNYINDKAKAYEILNNPIDRVFKSIDGGDPVYHTGSIWEDTLLSLSLQQLVFDPENTLNRDKYDENTIAHLSRFFVDWAVFSKRHSSFREPQLNKEKHPILNDPIEFVIDPYDKFQLAINAKLINLDYIGPYSHLTLPQLVETLAIAASDPLSKQAWINLLKGLLVRSTSAENIKLLDTYGETDDDLKFVNFELIANLADPVEPIPAKAIFDLRRMDRVLNPKSELSNNAIEARMRKHSIALEEHQKALEVLLSLAKQSVEDRVNAYKMNTDENSDIAIRCFSILSKKTTNRVLLREFADDPLFTPNAISSLAQYAKLGKIALDLTLSLVPMQGAQIINTSYGLGMQYLTNRFTATQTAGVVATSREVNLPLILIDLSELITPYLEVIIKSKNSDPDGSQKLSIKLSEYVATAINDSLDKLHYDIKGNGGVVPTESELLELLFKAAKVKIEEFVKNAPKDLHLTTSFSTHKNKHRESNESEGYVSDASKGSGKSKESAKSTSSKKSGGSNCAIS